MHHSSGLYDYDQMLDVGRRKPAVVQRTRRRVCQDGTRSRKISRHTGQRLGIFIIYLVVFLQILFHIYQKQWYPLLGLVNILYF